jgi:hypothetical protein
LLFTLFRKRDPQPAPAGLPEIVLGTAEAKGISFEALTEDGWVAGHMDLKGRLSDALNRREAIPISEVRCAPLDGSTPLTDAPEIHAIEPYDIILVFVGRASLPDDEDRRAAMRERKTTYDVELDLGAVQLVGRVFLYPGGDPQEMMYRQTHLFLAVTGARAYQLGQPIGPAASDVALVNRRYLVGVRQLGSAERA